ncbi:hypothetical protein CEH05_13790 [Halobacillus halophilus]|uniref:DUF4178 domain-containing protein n=1 Tax=Halobacillus halophilus (strain ATCC 35676 / DSM 2266 / JCM 20832 / KCTC 3685 / LMG 17431 / NBRC 102448 / NCIMB 2269) TaxID=866895 RepID=I0JPQ4_HALH3|nr:DUF4178 domain-containing protein [Halobacillus halophilus]ASF40154.1 hypothetical protein CEH05_13790 [Halobacillus halophilus]CCG46124.1 conserved hypothetical protein [Halobacillus halophilus DSM 2266]
MGFFSRLFSNQKKQVPEVEERTVLNIQIGDILTYDLVDYEVVGKITYRDGSYEWFAYQLLEGQSTKWLSAEMDDELELGIYETIKLPVSTPYPKELQYDGKSYYKDEEGEARVTGEGRSKNINGRTTHYADYLSEDEESYLSLEAWGSEVEVSYGHDIEAYEIKIIAGSK